MYAFPIAPWSGVGDSVSVFGSVLLTNEQTLLGPGFDRECPVPQNSGRGLTLSSHEHDKGAQEMTRGEFYNDAHALVIASSKTTATLLSGVTWYPLRNLEKLATKHDGRSVATRESTARPS
jgi:hypothetical protein